MKNWDIGENYRTKWSNECDYPNRKFNMINEQKLFLDRLKCGIVYQLSVAPIFPRDDLVPVGKDMHGASVAQTVDKGTPLCGFIPVSFFYHLSLLIHYPI